MLRLSFCVKGIGMFIWIYRAILRLRRREKRFLVKTTPTPCPRCRGNGTFLDFFLSDPPEEGPKNSWWYLYRSVGYLQIKCDKCKGTGVQAKAKLPALDPKKWSHRVPKDIARD